MKIITAVLLGLVVTSQTYASEVTCELGTLCKIPQPPSSVPNYKYSILSKDGYVYIPIDLKSELGDDTIKFKNDNGSTAFVFNKVATDNKIDTSNTERKKWTPEQSRLAAKENVIIKAIIQESPNVDKVKYPVFNKTLSEDYVYPCEGDVISGYGLLRNFGKLTLPHGGIDYECTDSAKAVMSGVVSYVGVTATDNDYVVVVSHGQKTYSLYRHLNGVKVKQGDHVTYNDELGDVGKHLHFSIFIDGNNINPDSFIKFIYGD